MNLLISVLELFKNSYRGRARRIGSRIEARALYVASRREKTLLDPAAGGALVHYPLQNSIFLIAIC